MSEKNNKKGLIIGAVVLLLLAGIGAGIFFMNKSKNKNQDNVKVDANPEFQEIAYSTPSEQPAQPSIPINFAELQKKNSDIYAWVKIDDTVIDYPVLQSTNDPEDYYLNHTVDRQAGLPGAIYSRMTDPKDFTGRNTILYGHNMKDGSMFKGLHQYEDKAYFDAHPYITIYTPTQALKYEVFAAVTYSDVLIPKKYDFSTEKGLNDYVASLKDSRNMANRFKEGVEIKADDKLITLSTCIASQPNNRYLVVGVLRNEG